MEDRVRENAYFRWLNSGKPCHRDLEFWLAAENEEIKFKSYLEHLEYLTIGLERWEEQETSGWKPDIG